jgi:undecaprenyl diphosphate synthase
MATNSASNEHQSPTSSTQLVPDVSCIPKHVAVIMDGNGRWATQRHLPRMAGHERGVAALRRAVEASVKLGIQALTVFAFSSENWRRPEEEVSFLMTLFLRALRREVSDLDKNDIQLRVVGDLSGLSGRLRKAIEEAEAKTSNNSRMVLTVAVNYGGRWDILNAMNLALAESPEIRSLDRPITEDDLRPYLALSSLPEPDLFIRTGGEQRMSNFMLWQLAYTELYFSDVLWPDFDEGCLKAAVISYQTRERRFGRTSGQLAMHAHSESASFNLS